MHDRLSTLDWTAARRLVVVEAAAVVEAAECHLLPWEQWVLVHAAYR